ncbi:hypothetical protein U3516DRAFT_920788, partial [Neocallimastix sp. 'constans']
MDTNANSDSFNKESKKVSFNAMSLHTIVNNNLNENTTGNSENYQQEKEEKNTFWNENLPFIDSSRTLPALTAPTTSSLSITTLLNTSISSTISSPCSKKLNHSPNISNISSSAINKQCNMPYTNYSDNSYNRCISTVNEHNSEESPFYINDESQFKIKGHSSKIVRQFIKSDITNENYSFHNANILHQKYINKTDTFNNDQYDLSNSNDFHNKKSNLEIYRCKINVNKDDNYYYNNYNNDNGNDNNMNEERSYIKGNISNTVPNYNQFKNNDESVV